MTDADLTDLTAAMREATTVLLDILTICARDLGLPAGDTPLRSGKTEAELRVLGVQLTPVVWAFAQQLRR